MLPIPDDFWPPHEGLAQHIRAVHRARSKAVHEGLPFPVTARVANDRWVPMDAGFEIFAEKQKCPPIAWFERVVSGSLRNYVCQAVTGRSFDEARREDE